MKDRVGEKNLMKNGREGRIAVYRGCNDIDVEFTDGTIARHRTYQHFKNGLIAPDGYGKTSGREGIVSVRLGEERVMKDGVTARIIAYRSSKDIDVEFPDGAVSTNHTYRNFVDGLVTRRALEKKNPKRHLGETRAMNDGKIGKILAYRSSSDVDILLDDGTVAKHRLYRDFRFGHIRNRDYRSERLGKENRMNCGEIARIVGYRNRMDIDVEFANGAVVKHRQYQAFLEGRIANPIN